jgi:hypothetical protein
MPYSGILCHVAFVRIDVLEECIASTIRVTRISMLGTLASQQLKHVAKKYYFFHSVDWLLFTANIVPSSPIPVTLMMVAIRSSKTSVLTRATWHSSQKTPFFTVTTMKTISITETIILYWKNAAHIRGCRVLTLALQVLLAVSDRYGAT